VDSACEPLASVIVVAYGVGEVDLSFLPGDAQAIVVHNDDSLPESAFGAAGEVTHLQPGSNLGFGGGVNLALERARGRRVILLNPDAVITRSHYDFLAGLGPDEVGTVAQVDQLGRPGSVVSRYPTAQSLVLTALRVGRLAPRGGRLRRLLSPLLGSWGRAHSNSLKLGETRRAFDMAEFWCSAAVCSIDRRRLCSIGGFDEGYFLYREDIDLCRRFAAQYPGATILVSDGQAALHEVGGSVRTAADAARVRRARIESAVRYASGESGLAWLAARVACRLAAHIPRLPTTERSVMPRMRKSSRRLWCRK
jgi:GT2 family glycosyltransferase